MSDLHLEVADNRAFADALRPDHPGDWLVLCGDVADALSDVQQALDRFADVFERVIWVPGNHELWTHRDDPSQLRGQARYQALVAHCRAAGVLTPEDSYPVWHDGTTVAPLFTLYDYSFGSGPDKASSLARAEAAGVVCTDEFLLHPDPYPGIEDWCAERLRYSDRRLAETEGPTVLVNHWPLIAELTKPLIFPQFAQWCGTVKTADWHTRHRAVAVVYGHLHIPRTTTHDGVPFEEVSLGYPREWQRRTGRDPALRRILPRP
jgi:3',5'-cyclic AMP phosphodiesterase CpdA